jgi:MFS family permease
MSAPSEHVRRRAVRLGVALTFFNFTGANAMRVLLTLYVLELGASQWVVGVLGGLLYLFPLLLSWPIGSLADRRASRGILVFAGVCAAVSLLLLFLFPVLPMFYVAAALNGLALAFYHVTLQNLFGTLSTSEDRAANFANFSLAGALSTFAGPLLAGVAIDAFGHAWSCLVIAAVSFIVLGLLAAEGRYLPPAQTRAGQSPAPPLRIDRPMVVMLVVSGLVQLGSDLFQFYVPIHGHQIGLSASAIGAVLAAFATASFIVRMFLARLSRRVPPYQLMGWVFLTGTAGLAIMPFANDAYTFALIAFGFGLGMGIGIPLTVMLMYESSAKGRSGRALGLRLTANNAVRMGGPVAFGALGGAIGVAGVLWVLALLMLAGAALSRWQAKSPSAA